MIARIKSSIARLRRMLSEAGELLEQIRGSNALAIHFENQNATLYGVVETMRRLNQFDRLRIEVQKSNQLINLAAAELDAFNNLSESLQRRIAAIEKNSISSAEIVAGLERDLVLARDEISRLRGELESRKEPR